jgi:hypothetical protein
MSVMVEPVAEAKDQPRELLLGIDAGRHAYFDLGAFEFEMGETLPALSSPIRPTER